MDKIAEAIQLMESKLRVLILEYKFLEEKNKTLLQNIDKLEHQTIKNQQLLASQNEKYELLKIAKTIEGSNKSTRDTKHKINALIREVDKCIVKLNQ